MIIFAWKASGCVTRVFGWDGDMQDLNSFGFVYKIWATTAHRAGNFFHCEGIDCGSLKVFSNLCSLFSFCFPSASSLLFIFICVRVQGSELEREHLWNDLVVTWYWIRNILNLKQKLQKGGKKDFPLWNLKRLFIHITIAFKWMTSVQTYVTVK